MQQLCQGFLLLCCWEQKGGGNSEIALLKTNVLLGKKRVPLRTSALLRDAMDATWSSLMWNPSDLHPGALRCWLLCQ